MSSKKLEDDIVKLNKKTSKTNKVGVSVGPSNIAGDFEHKKKEEEEYIGMYALGNDPKCKTIVGEDIKKKNIIQKEKIPWEQEICSWTETDDDGKKHLKQEEGKKIYKKNKL